MAGRKVVVKRNKEAEKVLLFTAFEEFMELKTATNKSEPTLRNYRQAFEMWCRFNEFDGETLAEDIGSDSIYHWSNSMLLDAKSIATVNYYIRHMRTFLNWCMDDDKKYIKKFKVQEVSGQQPSFKFFTDEEVQTLIKRPNENDSFATWRTWTIINWVLGTGNRASTICELKLGDINFNKREIELRHTKNKKSQIIPLSPALETIIREYIRTWRNRCTNEDWLFPNEQNVKLTVNALAQSMRAYCRKRGVNHSNIHGFRHNFARDWIRNNGNVYTLRNVLGHSSLEMTMRYVNLLVDDYKDDFERFNPLDNMRRSQKRKAEVKKAE